MLVDLLQKCVWGQVFSCKMSSLILNGEQISTSIAKCGFEGGMKWLQDFKGSIEWLFKDKMKNALFAVSFTRMNEESKVF